MKRDRRWQIKQLIRQRKRLTIKEICNIYGISVETARRDLNALEEEGIILRNYGGAVLIHHDMEEKNQIPPWNARFTSHLNEKRAIAREMLCQIPNHSTIALDSGTSMFELAKLLNEKIDLTILTNDLRMAVELSTHTSHTLYCIGGAIRRDDMITTGYLSTISVECFSEIDVALISGDGFDAHTGLMDYNPEMGALKAAIIQKSKRVILGIDHSKFAVNACFKVCPADSVDLIITDENAPQDAVAFLRASGVQTICACLT